MSFLHSDNIQCSLHFTDQQYEVDPISGNVTVEWEGTGPNALEQVSEFNCAVNNEALFACELLPCYSNKDI